VAEPSLPDEIKAGELDTEVRRDLRGLQKETAEKVARHLVAAGMLVDEEPERALEHARYARRRASRIAVVREAAGIVAYHAGEWNEALGELRAARRMGGGPGHIAVMADIERALGRPERALELARGPEVKELDRADRIELAIVAAGARRDLGEIEAAVVGLQVEDLDPKRREPWSSRLFYAYADNLLAAGRESDAVQWFVHAADADTDGETDALSRVAELTGEDLPEDDEDDIVFGVEENAPEQRTSVAPKPVAGESDDAEIAGGSDEAAPDALDDADDDDAADDDADDDAEVDDSELDGAELEEADESEPADSVSGEVADDATDREASAAELPAADTVEAEEAVPGTTADAPITDVDTAVVEREIPDETSEDPAAPEASADTTDGGPTP
jgi:hypothetical protein